MIYWSNWFKKGIGTVAVNFWRRRDTTHAPVVQPKEVLNISLEEDEGHEDGVEIVGALIEGQICNGNDEIKVLRSAHIMTQQDVDRWTPKNAERVLIHNTK